MASYIVLEEQLDDDDGKQHLIFGTVEARNAEHAGRLVAEKFSDEALERGVTLIAVPARNWVSGRNTFKAETRRRLLRS